jgi:hypothetical protein
MRRFMPVTRVPISEGIRERSWLVLVGITLLAAVVVFAAMPTLAQWSLGGFRPRQLFSSTSPDGRYRIDGFVRVDFPANEILDPSGTLRITLRDAHTGNALDQLFVGLYEANDFAKPTIAWEPSGRVRVQNLEGKEHELTATLNVRAWDPR